MNYRRYWNRYKAKIIPLLIIFLIFYIFFTSLSNIPNENNLLKNGFDDVDIQYELNKYYQLKDEYQLTGIILHWRRMNGVRSLVKTMVEYKDLFPRIVIWNNNPKKNLTLKDLLIENNSRIDIFNSDTNIKDQAKYRACELAKTNACFYVDDDWDMKLYMRSLYSNFLLEPTILHSITDQFTYFTNLMWTFFDKNIDFHTGFSWIGCGAIFSRDNAVRHLKYLNYFLDSNDNRDLISQGDQFFSVWMNQLPAQFNGRMIHSNEGAGSSFENFDFGSIQHRASILGIELLEKTLRNAQYSHLFQRKRAKNSFVTNTKSPCSYNDQFIFFTNCLPINNLEEIPFNITTDRERGTRANLPTQRSPYHNDLSFFEKFNTANAVDNDKTTCWKSNHPIQPGEYYGIDFQTIQINRDLSFSIEYLHESSLQEQLQISISLNSETWIPLPDKHSGILHDQQTKLVTFETRLFPSKYQIFRFIKFMSLTDQTNSFHVCEVKLID